MSWFRVSDFGFLGERVRFGGRLLRTCLFRDLDDDGGDVVARAVVESELAQAIGFLAKHYAKLAKSLEELKEPQAAATAYEEQIALLKGLAEQFPKQFEHPHLLGAALNDRGLLLERGGDLEPPDYF